MRVSLIALLMFSAAPVSAQSVRAGIEAWQKGDSAAAVAIWKPFAAKGDADAQFNLAQAYKLGRGVPVDLAQAQALYERAARQGHLDAQTSLGLLLFQNGNRSSALRWLKSAADAGEPRALLVYGTALFNGDGVPRDAITAYAMVSRAAAQGLEPAKTTLGEMDQIIPLNERQAGVAKAIEWAKPKRTAVAPQAKPVARATPPARTASVAPAKTVAAPSAPVAARPTLPPGSGGWRIQLGAFAQRSSADSLFSKLRGSGALAGKQAVLVPSGKMTRLQAGPYPTRADASAACRSLMARGQACFPVAAR